ncbi:PGF-CTERM-anchored ABC transporter substrate-binding protein [Halorientalis halophila]|uniref:PGF-CTERM-anchored ABC transporter substrate-binding protein n=1 Tax=Halorientalis halophila TaxID=3108499 RepID=UPI0030091ECA
MNARVLLLAAAVLAVAGAVAVGPATGDASSVDAANGDLVDAEPAAEPNDVAAHAAQDDCSFPVTRTDGTGTAVELAERPERIVALQPSDAQLLWEVGARDRVVGMQKNQYTAYLDGREDVGNISGGGTVERVVGLQPDLVLAANATDAQTVAQLRRTGVTVYHFRRTESLEEIAGNLETVGELVGSCESARAEATEFRLAVERAQTAHENASGKPQALYAFFDFTTGSGTHIHDMIEAAGGVNVAAEAGIEGYRQVNPEIVADRDPEWIVYPDDWAVPDRAPYNGTTAVRENQTIALDYTFVSQPGPKVAVPLTKLAKTWHPEGLARANATVNESDVAPTNETTQSTEGTEADGPGFGVVAALLAVLAATALVGRRD